MRRVIIGISLVLALMLTACGESIDPSTVPASPASNTGQAPPAGAGARPTATPEPTRPLDPIPSLEPVPLVEPAPMPAPATPEPIKTPEPTPPPAAVEPATTGGPHSDPNWDKALKTLDGATVGLVTSDTLNVRSAPRLDAPIVGSSYARHPVPIYDLVEGDVVEGTPVWYRIGDGRYVTSAYLEPLVPAPPKTFAGRWVDINLSTFSAIAYDGDTPVHAAIIIAGKNNATPTGTFEIFHRVRNETMDGATVGIPKSSSDYYYLPNVEYTQYFAGGGFALHENWWSAPADYGSYRSHGCINLMEPDAAFFWTFLSFGSVVNIHY